MRLYLFQIAMRKFKFLFSILFIHIYVSEDLVSVTLSLALGESIMLVDQSQQGAVTLQLFGMCVVRKALLKG